MFAGQQASHREALGWTRGAHPWRLAGLAAELVRQRGGRQPNRSNGEAR